MAAQGRAQSSAPTAVNFSAVRCGFCKALEPRYGRLSDQYAGKIGFIKLIVDDPKNHEILHHVAVEGTRPP